MVKKVHHMSQLLALKHYSDGQEAIVSSVEKQNKMFDELVSEITGGEFHYQMAEQVFKRFGEPVFSREVEFQGKMTEQWLYRHAKDFNGDKVYMYFDGQGSLFDFEYVKGRS